MGLVRWAFGFARDYVVGLLLGSGIVTGFVAIVASQLLTPAVAVTLGGLGISLGAGGFVVMYRHRRAPVRPLPSPPPPIAPPPVESVSLTLFREDLLAAGRRERAKHRPPPVEVETLNELDRMMADIDRLADTGEPGAALHACREFEHSIQASESQFEAATVDALRDYARLAVKHIQTASIAEAFSAQLTSEDRAKGVMALWVDVTTARERRVEKRKEIVQRFRLLRALIGHG
jgi:hypothetical protein